MLGILPSMFEETFFRAGVQNLLSRWWKMPVLSIIVTAIIFSIVHGSYIGFLSRVVLGFILGWMYYRTGNIWLNIIAHATNNVIAVTLLYIKFDANVPLWLWLISLPVVYGLFILFDRISQYQINKPGEEVIIRTDHHNQPSSVTDRP